MKRALVFLALFGAGILLIARDKSAFRVDYYRSYEIEAYSDHFKETGELLTKRSSEGSPYTSRLSFGGKAVVASEDDPLNYVAAGLLTSLLNLSRGLDGLRIWFYLLYGVCFAMIIMALTKYIQLLGLHLAASIVASGIVLAVLSICNNSLPFTTYGFTPEIPHPWLQPFLQRHNPWERVDAWYGSASTAFVILFATWLLIGLSGGCTKKRVKFQTFGLIAVSLVTLLVGEMSRLGSGLALLPVITFGLQQYRVKPSKLKSVLITTVILTIVTICLRYLVLFAFALVRQFQSGIPWSHVPLSSPVGHRLLLGLSFRRSGIGEPGINGLLWSDNDVFLRIVGDSKIIPFSSEYNKAALSEFVRTISSQSFEFVAQIVEKILFSPLFFGYHITILMIVYVVIRFQRNARKDSPMRVIHNAKVTIFATIAIGAVPILSSRPFSMYFFYIKPMLDICVVLLVSIAVSRFIFSRREQKNIDSCGA